MDNKKDPEMQMHFGISVFVIYSAETTQLVSIMAQ